MTTLTVTRTPVPPARDDPLSLAVLGRPAFSVVVRGLPATQGSKEYKGHRATVTKTGARVSVPILADSSGRKLDAWRNAVCAAAVAAVPPGWVTLDEPVVADLIVSLPRLSRTPKTKRTVPDTKPDLSKLLRAVEDALATDTARFPGRRVLAEDSRIVAHRRLAKVWTDDPLDTDSLPHPGAIIRLWRYPATLLGPVATLTP